MTTKIFEIKKLGQKIWLDNLTRELIISGKLNKMIENDGLCGITSNPTIFHKAFENDPNYKEDLQKIKLEPLDFEYRYESLVIPDIQSACDIFMPMYNSSNKEDGYVSFELSPYLAHNTEGSILNAKRLWKTIAKENLMIKIPATSEGIKAFEVLISEGINVNITLLFSLPQVINTWNSYIRGLTTRYNKGLPLDSIKAVASFFLSRIDNAIDAKLPANLQGKAAISLAKTAYSKYLEIFGKEFKKLKDAGARPQYLLWASTGTKNPDYSDVLYIEELIGPQTINTVPYDTLVAFNDHGNSRITLTRNLEEAQYALEQVKINDINMESLGQSLQVDGLKIFTQSFDKLINLMK